MIDKVYWFLEHSTTEEILQNIYILLFIYCIFQIVMKILACLHNTRW